MLVIYNFNLKYLFFLGAWSTKTNSIVKENAELRCKVLKMKCYFYLQATSNIDIGDEIFFLYSPSDESTYVFPTNI